jgi:DNA-binding NarL/FixJ family response regulator
MKRLRILVADDHEVVRHGLHALLGTQAGWEVVGDAVDGREAVEKAVQLKPDVVILDINMPGINGLDATPLILEAAPQSEVLIFTMHQPEEMEQTARKAGARGYVLKAAAGRDLPAAVRALSEHSTFFHSAGD